jgi:two-component system chemotaxis response regulator CheY
MPTKILVVDDDSETREFMTVMLELRDYEVITAKNGLEGIIKASLDQPDLVVTDLGMPGVNGIDMIKQLRSRPECAGIPILVITGYDMETANEAILAGANRAVAKPLDPDLVHVFIKNLIVKKRVK